MAGEKLCFLISPIGERGSATRERADAVRDAIIRPALEQKGYRVERADSDKTPGDITDRLIGTLIDADLVVADLTGLNPNVMYELAIRHAVAKPVILMMEHGGQLPFDISPQNTIFFAATLAGWKAAVDALDAAEEAVRTTNNLGNPIKRVIDLRALQTTGTSSEQAIAGIVSGLREDVTQLRRAVESGMTYRQARGSQIPGVIGPRLMALALLQRLQSDARLQRQTIEVVDTKGDDVALTVDARFQNGPLQVTVGEGWWNTELEALSNHVVSVLLANAEIAARKNLDTLMVLLSHKPPGTPPESAPGN